MASIDALREFEQGKSVLAVRINSEELPGLFTKRLRVPPNAAALALFSDDGTTSIFAQGQEITGQFQAVLVKAGEIYLSFDLPDLRTQDSFTVHASLSLSVSIDSSTVESFKNFMKFMPTTRYTLRDLEDFVRDRIRSACAEYVAARPAQDLHRRDKAPEVERVVADRLESHFLGTGLRFEKIVAAEFVSKDYESQIHQIQRVNKEQQLRQERMARIAEFLKHREDVRELLEKVQDPHLRSVLYTWLISGGRPDDTSMGQALDEAALNQLMGAMQSMLAGQIVPAEDILTETAERIYVAIGSRVVEIDAHEPFEARDYDAGEPLRSLRSVRLGDRELLILGGRRACVVLDLAGDDRRTYPLPDGKVPRGGINSVAVYGNTLYATHSEYGLAAWDLREPGKPAQLYFEEQTRGQKTTRAVQIVKDNLVFAAGSTAVLASLSSPQSAVKIFASRNGPLTALALASAQLFAATEDGTILQWDLDRPESPEPVLRKNEAIFGLKLAKIRNVAHMVYSCNDAAVHARMLGQTLETAYEGPGGGFTMFDATSDLLCATQYRARKIFLWRAGNPKRPVKILDLTRFADKEVMDICIRKRTVIK